MPTSNRTMAYPPLDPDAVLRPRPSSIAGIDLLIMMHGWSYDERHLFALRPPSSPGADDRVAPRADPRSRRLRLVPQLRQPDRKSSPQVANAAVEAVPMVLQMMRHRPFKFAYGVQLGGFVVDDEQPGDADLAALRPRVFWGREHTTP